MEFCQSEKVGTLPSSIESLHQERESVSAFLLKTGWARWTNNH